MSKSQALLGNCSNDSLLPDLSSQHLHLLRAAHIWRSGDRGIVS